MSIHRSLKSNSRLEKHRNVLTRIERIIKLETLQKWDEQEGSIFCLPKIRSIKAKSKKKAEEETATAETEETPAEQK